MPTFEPCALCGCTEFNNEAGFYYCKECQLQSQEVQDYEFDEHAALTSRSVTKKVIKKQKKKVEHVTSWECYNYVLLGLTNELVDLGVDEGFRDIVQAIWFKYLKSIEVIRKDPTEPPKLQAYNNAMDAEIIYKRLNIKATKRKRRTASPSDAGSTISTASASHFDRNKSKQALIRAEYDANSSTQITDVSLQNISLSSLGNTADDTKKKHQYLQYTNKALKEIKKNMPKSHLKKHIEDTNSDLHCHKITFNSCSASYKDGPEILKRSKLYVILNMALLLSKERIQLGDMLRFMHESHLSFNHLKHFFPEFLNDKVLNLTNLKNNQAVYNHHSIRLQTAKLAFHLKMENLEFTPDLVDLTKRYCKEMNLPNEICDYVINLISRTKPRMKVRKESFKFPNYEARVVCFIIFTLKLLFGLDGVTELHLSNLTKLPRVPTDSFNFKEWLEHICYRKLVVSKHHFPTHFKMSQDIDSSDNYIAHMKEHYDNLGIEQDDNVDYTLITDLLTNLKDRLGECSSTLKFEHTLTPFCDYLKVLLDSNRVKDRGYLCDILERDFSDKSVDYLINSDNYLSDIAVQDGGANADIKKVPLFIYEKIYDSFMREEMIPCTLVNDKNAELPIKRIKMEMTQDFGVHSNVDQVDVVQCPVLHKPETKYWLLSGREFETMPLEYYNKYYRSFPPTFRLVVEECARVTSQTTKDIIEELNILETHLCYIFDFDTNKLSDFIPVDTNVIKIVNRYGKFW